MTEWITPKTDWKVTYDEDTGEYVGDYFNSEDYDRIVNNMNVLRQLYITIYGDSGEMVRFQPVEGKVYVIYVNRFYPIARSLNHCCVWILNRAYEDYLYFDNLKEGDSFPTYEKLNSLEKTMLLCYEQMNEFIANRRQFKWRLGIEGGTKKWL